MDINCVLVFILTKPGGLLLGHEQPQGVVGGVIGVADVAVGGVEELGQAHAHVGQHGPVGGGREETETRSQQLTQQRE